MSVLENSVQRTTSVPKRMSRASQSGYGGGPWGPCFAAALKHVARTQNMSALARDTGLNRGNLYEALSEDGNPTLTTLLRVTRALGLRLHLEPVEIPVEARRPSKRGNLPAESTST